MSRFQHVVVASPSAASPLSVNARASDGNDGLTFNRLTIGQALDAVRQMLDGADQKIAA